MGGSLIRRVGHARAFSCSMAWSFSRALTISLGVHPLLGSSHAASTALRQMNFIITQSWLNHASENHWRGAAMALFYMAMSSGSAPAPGSSGKSRSRANLARSSTNLLHRGRHPADRPHAPAHAARPARVSIDIPMVWRISPVAFIGVLASGGLSMLVQGFYADLCRRQFRQSERRSALMFVMQFGLLFIQ